MSEGARAELREAAANATPGAAEPWHVVRSAHGACHVRDNSREWVAQFAADEAAAVHIAAASPAVVLALLDERDALAEQVAEAKQRETRVRALHQPTHFDYPADHWVIGDARPKRTLCVTCTGLNWPCPTIAALDEGDADDQQH